MTRVNDIVMALLYSLPPVAALICLIMMVLRRQSGLTEEARRLTRIMLVTYSVAVFVWACMVMYIVAPAWFVVLQAPFFYTFPLWCVLLYRIVFELTGTGEQERFPIYHYILPAILPLVCLIWSLFVPFEAQLYIVESRGQAMEGYEAFTLLFASKPPVFAVWDFVYAFLCLRRITRYRRVIGDYTADQGRMPVRWLLTIFWLMIVGFLLPSAGVWSKTMLMGSPWMGFLVLAFTVAQIMLAYNVIAGNYVVIQPTEESSDLIHRDRQIDIEKFEQYILTKKTYLNPRLRITDMATDLHTNRTYLSNFINARYGMNFSRYVNRLRLEELDRMRLDPQHHHLTGMELVLHAGFTNYRAYLRVKKEEDRLRTIAE